MTMPQVFSNVSTQQVINDAVRPGPPGASAYDVAVANGFTGTQQEWLQSLIGPAVPLIMQGDVAAPSNVPAASTLRVQDSGKAWTVVSTGNAHVWDGSKFVIVRFRGADGELTKALGDTYYSKLGHTHTKANITDLQPALDAKANSTHTHQLNDVWKNASVLASGSDLNAIGSGVYQLSGASVTNGPSTTPKGTLISVFMNGVGTQEVVLVDGVKWTRGTADGTTWTSWMRPATDAKPPAITRAMNANQSIPTGTFTKVLFDRSVHSTAGINYANGNFTVLEDGLYTISVAIMVGHTSGGGTWKGAQLQLNTNAVVDIGFDFTGIALISFSRDVSLISGDTLNIWACQYSGANVPVYSMANGSGSQVSIRRVGARVI